MNQTKWKKKKFLGIIPVFLVLVMLASLLAGCGGGADPKAMVQSANTNAQSIRAVSGSLSVNMAGAVSGQTESISLSGDYTIFLDSGKMHMNLQMSSGGQTEHAEVYVVEENGEMVSYTDDGSGFKRGQVDSDYMKYFDPETIKEVQQNKEYQDMVRAIENSCSYENRGQQNINGHNCTYVHCEVDLPAALESLAHSGALDSSMGANREQVEAAISMVKGMLENVTIPIDYYISEGDQICRRVSVDLKDTINSVMGKVGALVSSGEIPNYTAANMQIDINAVNDEVADIVLPAGLPTGSETGTTGSGTGTGNGVYASHSLNGTVWKVTEVESGGVRVKVDDYIKTLGKSGEMVFEFKDGQVEALVGSEVVGEATPYTYEDGKVTIDGVTAKIENNKMVFQTDGFSFYLELSKAPTYVF